MLLWTLVGCLTIAALLPVLWPLLMRRASVPSAAGADPLVAVYRDRQREIERERAAGRLTADEARTALDELVAQMARELPEESAPAATTQQSTGSVAARGAAIAIALLVPAASLMVYLALGTPELATDEITVADDEIDERKLDQMIADLERRAHASFAVSRPRPTRLSKRHCAGCRPAPGSSQNSQSRSRSPATGASTVGRSRSWNRRCGSIPMTRRRSP
jgi:cytochrome c-type biogenesis protein CcmI